MWWLPLVPFGFFTDRGSRMRWLAMPAIVILTALTASVGKLAIRRPRPGSSHSVVPWGRLSAAAFPSTHSACAFAIAGWLRGSRHGRWLHAVAVLIGCSRVRCRAHHASDVVAGGILGYGIVWQLDKVRPRQAEGCGVDIPEVERGEAERPLEDLVVEGDEAGLGRGAPRVGDELPVRLDQPAGLPRNVASSSLS